MKAGNLAGELNIDQRIQGIDPQSVHQLRLASGALMPAAGFGTFHSDWAQAYIKAATVEAIRVGWRHIDTARAYENEEVVGEAISDAIRLGYLSSRSELFITAKLWNGHMCKQDVEPALNNTLRALGVEQVDMYLNHWPWPNVHVPGATGDFRNPDAVPYIHEAFMETWGEIVRLKKAGKIVDIGVSNHTEATLKLLLRDSDAYSRPVLNQMELHPLFQQTKLRRFMESQGITCTGYMPLGSPHRPRRDRFKEHRADLLDPLIQAIAAANDISAAMVCLNWAHLRENKSGGYVAMSTRSKWMVDNLSAATQDFLSPEQMVAISGNDTPVQPGIDANNRLIRGQVFLWPEALGDWRVLWNDSQVFETRAAYQRFKKSFSRHYAVWKDTVFHVPVFGPSAH
ncbi:MAG: aldo/keto reductase [Anaerolineales bacterium]|uniref:Aldo/keto reductase n=1 Tax=Candidatus Desulfolinea nitratireducens TaxID=2841698 RepID=A0A8J6TGP5_9CHLR|nr:aldo/keto reductase [Candidatus Desulfolinea nitratireducens]